MNELIKRYKETKNQDLFEEILNKNKGLAYKIVSKYKETSLYSYDDMHQICMLSLIKAIETYDETKNMKFSSYLYTLMNRDLAIEICVNQNRKKRKAEISSLDISGNGDSKRENTIKDSIADETVNIEEEIMNKAIKKFSKECLKDYKEKHEKKYMAIELILQGYTQRQAKEMLPYSQQTICSYWLHFKNYLKQRAITEGILNK